MHLFSYLAHTLDGKVEEVLNYFPLIVNSRGFFLTFIVLVSFIQYVGSTFT